MRPDQAVPVEERFFRLVSKTDTCWLWTGTKGKDGYGKFRIGSRSDDSRKIVRAHRMSWELHMGVIPDGSWVLHHCDCRACVRPDHLYLGGPKENGNDMRTRKRSPKARQTHCLRGHEFTEKNTRLTKNGTRHCRKCEIDRRKKE